MDKYEVLLLINGVNDKKSFEKHLKKEGFEAIENEEFAYIGHASLPVMNTRAFIFDVLKKALSLSNTKSCSFICKLGENPFETYAFNESKKSFEEVINQV